MRVQGVFIGCSSSPPAGRLTSNGSTIAYRPGPAGDGVFVVGRVRRKRNTRSAARLRAWRRLDAKGGARRPGGNGGLRSKAAPRAGNSPSEAEADPCCKRNQVAAGQRVREVSR